MHNTICFVFSSVIIVLFCGLSHTQTCVQGTVPFCSCCATVGLILMCLLLLFIAKIKKESAFDSRPCEPAKRGDCLSGSDSQESSHAKGNKKKGSGCQGFEIAQSKRLEKDMQGKNQNDLSLRNWKVQDNQVYDSNILYMTLHSLATN